jgi:hypothetical protein
MVRAIGTVATNGCGYPGIGGNTITGCMGIMSAVASGIANMPESITTTMTTMVMNTTTITITRISP